MAEHDQRFKTLLREFLPEFLRLFFPQCAAAFDLDRIEWLDKEFFVAPPHGEKLELDLVAKLSLRSAAGKMLALIHIEVESRKGVAGMPRRMFEYFMQLRHRHSDPVLPIADYMRVGREGIGVESYIEEIAGMEILRYQYLYVGLPALSAEQYVAGSNWLGVALAALMRMPDSRKARLRAEALRRILLESTENDYRRLLLQECVEAYLQLSKRQQREFKQLLRIEPYKEIEPMMVTTFEKGVAKGRLEKQREVVRLLLERKFGSLSEAVQHRLLEWSEEQLDKLILAIQDAPSLRALGLETDKRKP